MKYFYSKHIIDLFGIAFANNVSLFVRKHVLIHEKHFLYCNRTSIRHYGEYSNTPLEGTNFGIKHASISTHPGLSMDNSMVIMSLQSDKHVVKTNGKVIRDNQRHCRNYKKLVHNKLTTVASSILSSLMNRIKYYESIRINAYEWKVKKKEYNRDRRSYIPDFDVISTVSLKQSPEQGIFRLECSCSYTKVFGIPCVHSMVVSETFKPKWKELTHHDISVRWWKKYYLFSLPDKIIPDYSKQKRIKQVFHTLRRHELVGIHVKTTDFTHVPIHKHPIPQEYNEFPHIIKCGNYPNSDEMEDFDPFHSNLDSTISQITVINTQLSSDDEDDIFDFASDNVSVSSNPTKKMKSFYTQLHPNFKEAVNWITNQEEVDEFSKLMDKFVSDIKVKYQKENDATKNQVYISSNLFIEKSKKHHGCSGWGTSTKRKR